MEILEIIIWCIILKFGFEFIIGFGNPCVRRKIPDTVKIASFVEAVCWIIFFFFALFSFVWIPRSVMNSVVGPMKIMILLLCIAVLLLGMSAHLNAGNYKARKICLIVSIIRLLTIVGIPFSIISIYLLYFTKSSREFYSSIPKSDKYVEEKDPKLKDISTTETLRASNEKLKKLKEQEK